jgi:O-acetyl-ADP-ribose deacetylase (regulator of RNase III)
MTNLNLILVDPLAAVCAAWELHFENLPNVQIVNGPFEKLRAFDCMVSAANSFGLMDGGVDLAIIQFFGFELMDQVQERIIADYMGEQSVGTCFIIETGCAKHPFLAHTPTMRTPMPITRTDNVYRAMWATLLAVRQHNLTSKRAINTIACPGLGTATGRMPADEAARQMACAWRHFLSPPARMSWPHAITRQNAVGYGGDPVA